jgi:hypothetical protein
VRESLEGSEISCQTNLRYLSATTNEGLQIARLQPLLLHAEVDGLDGRRQGDREPLRLIASTSSARTASSSASGVPPRHP